MLSDLQVQKYIYMYIEFKLKRIHLKGQIKKTLVGERLMFLFYR